MKHNKFYILISFILLLFSSCELETKYSYLKAVNKSYNRDYEDVITDIFISENALNNSFRSVWTGQLKPGQSSLLEIDCGNFGVKFRGIRYYHSGIEKPINVMTGYKSPIRFAPFWSFKLIYDGIGIEIKEEN